jgi:hypothetical protein
MYERTLNALIRARCRELGLHHLGLTTHKIPGGSTPGPGPKGYPDWTIAGPGGIIFREAKSGDGRRSLAQIAWGRALAAAGADYAIWRPADWETGRIEAELRRVAGRAPAGPGLAAAAVTR